MDKPAKFRTRPHEVEAMKWDGSNTDELLEWGNGALELATYATLKVFTPDDMVPASTGCWIVKRDGVFFPCFDEEFTRKYEPCE